MKPWTKTGLIYCPDSPHDLMYSHAQIPSPLFLSPNLLRIYFSSRDTAGRCHPYFLDYDIESDRVTQVCEEPLFAFGSPGTFDDSGIMPASALRIDDKIFLYYIGWNPQVTVSYRLSIGLAISDDGGVSFQKYSRGPLLDRSTDEHFFNTAPCVLFDEGRFRMWYVSCTGWRAIKGKMEPLYQVRYAESDDGIAWERESKPTIDYQYDGEAIGRPWVVKDGNDYHMWYSTRGSIDYRIAEGQHYMIGYAYSSDGRFWSRRDDEVGIGLSEAGWDSEMLEYCSVVPTKLGWLMLYNGNSFGRTGFGGATLDCSRD